jgi:hypothetical protein
MSELSKNDEVILAMIAEARDEIVARIKTRDSLIASYAAAVAATIGFAKAALATDHPEALYILPYLSFAFTLLVCYQHLSVATLSTYCNADLWPRLDCKAAPMYEATETFLQHRTMSTRQRSLGQLIILVGPSILALAVNSKHALSETPPYVLYWWFGLVATLMSAYTVDKAYKYQKDLQKQSAASSKSFPAVPLGPKA